VFKILQELPKEEFDKLESSGGLKKIVEATINGIKELDESLKPLDILNWGKPMGLTTKGQIEQNGHN
jgi:hypothetical protein